MFAIVDIAGFQEKVSQGDKLEVPTLDVEVGKTKVFDKVYLISSDDDISIGMPYVSGASVELKVLEHGKDDKIRVYKMRRRKRYRRVHGHRQGYTAVEVVKITAGGAKKAAPKKEEKEVAEVK